MERVLVTGGAGFIGSHLVDALVGQGDRVLVLDCLEPQVHGAERRVPSYLNPAAELIVGDVRDGGLLWDCLRDADAVFHLAAAVGVGQSMYEIGRYVGTNVQGTADLLHLLANRSHSVRKLVVASSMSVYGEGAYHCPNCGPSEPHLREEADMHGGLWDIPCPGCGALLAPVATAEGKRPQPNSVYAISKRDQEEMCLCVGKAYGLPSVALRLFNTYGPRQALSNPYTGAAAIFFARAVNGKPPLVYEDGLQSRDFVHVSDVVRAMLLVMQNDAANYRVFNVGSGRHMRVVDIAEAICREVGADGVHPEVTAEYRKGDIRHCFADIGSLAALGYRPEVDFESGIRNLLRWVTEQTAEDQIEEVNAELKRRGLVT